MTKLLSLPQAAKLLPFSEEKLRLMCRNGQIDYFDFGTEKRAQYFFSQQQIDDYLNRCLQSATLDTVNGLQEGDSDERNNDKQERRKMVTQSNEEVRGKEKRRAAQVRNEGASNGSDSECGGDAEHVAEPNRRRRRARNKDEYALRLERRLAALKGDGGVQVLDDAELQDECG